MGANKTTEPAASTPRRSRSAVLGELRERIAEFPAEPGVYLFKDAEGRVLYVGKAKALRSRVASYFQEGANLAETRGADIERMIARLVVDIEVLPCDSEVDALLHEARLIKDIRPRFNIRQKDDKSFPYLMIATGEQFPGVYITREPAAKGVKLFGPFVNPKELRAALPLLQRAFKFRTCTLDIHADDEKRRRFRPCILYNIKQCTAPCAAHISKEDYRRSIRRLIRFLQAKRSEVLRQLTREMNQAAEKQEYERAAELRDELKAIEGLARRGLAAEHLQPEVFGSPIVVEPRAALGALGEYLHLSDPPRSIEGAHLGGAETVGSIVTFIDGKPFKSGYRRFKIVSHDRNDDYASMREVVWRRYRYAGMDESLFPDIILIDGGKGQLAAAYSAFDELEFRPPALLSLAKAEELIHVHGRDEPLKLKRTDPALRLLQYVRDEAHRFAQHYHHILRRKKVLGEKSAPARRPRRRRGGSGSPKS